MCSYAYAYAYAYVHAPARACVHYMRSNAKAHLGPDTRLGQGTDLLRLRGCGGAALQCEALKRVVLRLHADLYT